MAPRANTRRRRTTPPKVRFDQKLVLFQWMLRLFEVDSFIKLAEPMKHPEYEGFDEENISHHYHILTMRTVQREHLPKELLLLYDQNIVRHWKTITERRNRIEKRILYPKYFQYLSLLFAEIYLDRYFSGADKLLVSLNQEIERFNDGKEERDQVKAFQLSDLHKIAFWSATGSGKTLIMHCNILQYKHYLKEHKKERGLNRIILLTPNEGLSNQHLDEFMLSGMDAELFDKDGRGLFAGKSVEIIDIHKLKDVSGDKTVAVESFENNNLVLVDEGHRGSSSAEVGQWMKKRSQLSEDGFSFEYSATFGQAIKASGSADLENEYAKCILFDYSYKYFFNDGYGKQYNILNLQDDSDEEFKRKYLTASLVAFYEQQKIFEDNRKEFNKYLIEKPLWIFVGASVNAVRTENRRQVSDVVDILLFLSEFVTNDRQAIDYITSLIEGSSALLDDKDRDLFSSSFKYLRKLGLSSNEVFADILKVLFNASAKARIHIENLKGADGEIALRLGDNDPFGVINVGDSSSLCKLCDEQEEIIVIESDFSGSLFRQINNSDSQVNMLIGSKKFTEGWSSWRVSTMGLMNIGRGEGSQIIQLFGRGVRLKGLEFCLKRSKAISGLNAPADLETLETLNIFGIRADYMKQFKEYLEEEGLPTEDNRLQFVLPTIKNLGSANLKIVRLKEGLDFKKQGPKPTLEHPPDHIVRHPVILDWYPKIQALTSKKTSAGSEFVEPEQNNLTPQHVAFMELDTIYFSLQRFKNERAWYNMNLSKEEMKQLLLRNDWYRLYIPGDELRFRSFEQVRRWQEIATALLTKYCDRFYKYKKAEWENEHLEYHELTEDDPNFVNEYQFYIDKSSEDIIAKLESIKAFITAGNLKDAEAQKLRTLWPICFGQHLYQPLVYVNSSLIEIKPIVLQNDSERDFVTDLRAFYEENSGYFDGKELYLLRNMSKGRGIGFFEAGNFYPDFILWLVTENKQNVAFIDPKGIMNLRGLDDPKIQFGTTIKSLEQKLNDPEISLYSFILSNTSFETVKWWTSDLSKADFEKNNVLFQYDDRATYIRSLLEKTKS